MVAHNWIPAYEHEMSDPIYDACAPFPPPHLPFLFFAATSHHHQQVEKAKTDLTKSSGMSWIQESKRTWLERFCINVLKEGPIPKHVAFIMDGNRRYATQNGLEKLEGHAFGFNKLSETLQWCLDFGITEVTVYTFSIENFKRPVEEVDCLMNLAREKFKELLEKKDKLEKYGVCIRIFGDITLLPVDLQMLVAEAVLETYSNTKTYLNVCFAYTSREEICTAVKDIASEVLKGNLQEHDINSEVLNHSLYSSHSPEVVVRTSGEVRLSDFLLWQSSYSVLAFFKVLWPDFSIWYLMAAIVYYQRSKLKEIEEKHAVHDEKGSEQRRQRFYKNLDRQRYNKLLEIRNGNTKQVDPPLS